jgi:hypothetical protein
MDDKLPLCLTKYQAIKMYWGSGSIVPRILNSARAGIAQWYSAGLRAGWSGIRVPVRAGNFCLHPRVQTRCRTHPASYPMGTRSSFPGGKAAGAWRWQLTSIQCQGQECVELYHHSLNTPLLHGAQLKHRDNFIFLPDGGVWSTLRLAVLPRGR